MSRFVPVCPFVSICPRSRPQEGQKRTNGDKTGHFGTNWETPPFSIYPRLALLKPLVWQVCFPKFVATSCHCVPPIGLETNTLPLATAFWCCCWFKLLSIKRHSLNFFLPIFSHFRHSARFADTQHTSIGSESRFNHAALQLTHILKSPKHIECPISSAAFKRWRNLEEEEGPRWTIGSLIAIAPAIFLSIDMAAGAYKVQFLNEWQMGPMSCHWAAED